MSGPRGQHGFLVIVAAVLIVVIGFLGVAITFLISANMRAGAENYDAARALAVAESGLEYGTYDWSMNGNTGPSTQNVGAGSFTFFADDNGSAFGLGNPLANPNQKHIVSTGIVGTASRTVDAIVELGGVGGIVFDANSSKKAKRTNSTFWRHRVGAGGVGRFLIVGVSTTTPGMVGTVTYNGRALDPVGSVDSASVRVSLWRQVDPDVGNNNVVVTFPASTDIVAGAVSFTGVDGTNPIDAPVAGIASNVGLGVLASVTLNTLTDNAWVVDTLAFAQNATAAVGPGQVQQWNDQTTGGGGGARVGGAGSTEGPRSPPGAVTMSWTLSSNKDWAIGAVALKPAPPGANIIAWREVFP